MSSLVTSAKALFAAIIILSGLGAPQLQAAQPLKRIGVLYEDPQFIARIESFRSTLRSMGYVEGESVVYAYHLVDRQIDTAARELVASGVDLLIAPGTPAALALRRATTSVPIIFVAVDPVRSGLVANFAKPEGNATGIATLSEETGSKRLELLRELLPKASRIAVLTNSNNYGSTAQLERIQAAATILGFKPVAISARSSNELASALASISAQRFDALIVLSDSIMIANTGSIAQHALKAGLPSISAYRFYPEAGGLMSYGPDWSTLWKQCAIYADRIFKGSNPAELPVEQPSKFEFVVNQKTAKIIGIIVPQGILMRADEVIR